MDRNSVNILDEIVVDSPGRINLIGGHTDYNNGYVLPAAIDRKIGFRLWRNSTMETCNIHSKGYNEPLHIDLRKIEKSSVEWHNYLLGVIAGIQKLGHSLEGFDCEIESDLPIGSGLSSSAALECGLASGLNALFQLGLSKLEIITLSRQAEHDFVGTKCGIMDQFSSVYGKSDHFIFLDCSNLDYKYVPACMGPYQLLLLNTNISHRLSDGQYNSRQNECFEAVAQIQKRYANVSSLRDVDMDILNNTKALLSDIQYQRALFIVQENQRLLDAVEALESKDIESLGSLLYACHEGLRDLYDISCPELNFLVDYAKEQSFVAGARMVGGGFGGCTIHLVHENHMETYIREISKAYLKEFGIDLGAIPVHTSNGTTHRKLSDAAL